jgi:hypothetical protein
VLNIVRHDGWLHSSRNGAGANGGAVLRELNGYADSPA